MRRAVVLFFGMSLLLSWSSREADARTWPAVGSRVAAGFAQSCLKEEFAGVQNICSTQIVLDLPLELDTYGSKFLTVCGSNAFAMPTPVNFTCVGVGMNQTGTEFSQSSESLVSSPNACSATGTLTVPLEGYLYAQCNLNPGTVLASVNVTVP